MNPHELAAMPGAELASHFRYALAQKNQTLVSDAFAQLEWRFQRLTATIEGSQEFLDQFFALRSSPEVRRLHIDDPLVRCAARLEYLLEIAGERARLVTEEAILCQVVESRARGFEIIKVLAAAPEEGWTAGKLAKRLRISRSNLSPLIATFYGYGIIDRRKQGKHVFLTLTVQGHALLDSIEGANGKKKSQKKQYGFRMLDRNASAAEVGPEIVRAALREVANDIRHTPFSSKRSMLGVADHAVRRVEERIRLTNPVAAGILRAYAEEIKKSLGIVSEVTREVARELLEVRTSNSESPSPATGLVQDELARREELHRETAPLAALLIGTVGEEIRGAA